MNSATSTRRPRYSVIIVTYNSLDNIQVCLQSLRKYARGSHIDLNDSNQEIIVVDNNSRDGTPQYLASQTDIKTILNKSNHGFSKGCNQGTEIATGEYLVFLNPDTIVTAAWADTMAQYFQDPSVGAVGPVSNYVAGLQRLDLNLPPQWQNAKKIPGDGAMEISSKVAEILKEANARQGLMTKLLIGFCFMIQRSLFQAMNGMDEDLFLGNDDLDLSWRLRNNGRKLIVATDAFVFHEGQKSFQTEKKSHVDVLTQESTDALYKKLVAYYGCVEKVPAATDLWGIGWFSPTPSLIESLKSNPPKMEKRVKTESKEKIAWKGLSTLLFVGQDSELKPNAVQGMSGSILDPVTIKLNKSLNSLPVNPRPDILILNCSNHSLALDDQVNNPIRKLDLGASCTPKQSLEIALNILPGNHLLFSLTGIEFSALFNQWMEAQDLSAIKTASSIPSRIQWIGESRKEKTTVGKAEEPCLKLALICNKDWLKKNLSLLPDIQNCYEFMKSLREKIHLEANSKNSEQEIPWLLAQSQDIPPEFQLETTPAIGNRMTDRIALYPASLQSEMRKAKQIAFAGTAAQTPGVKGAFHVYNLLGNLVPLADHDLVILRITPDLIEQFSERILNIRRIASKLERMIVVFDEKFNSLMSQASIRAELLKSGFTVTGTQPYYGIREAALESEPLIGWHQIETIPRKSDWHLEKLVSIVILGFNQVNYTKKCIESIRKYTRQKYELILVDNGSKDETKSYFQSIPGAKVILNSNNLGVSRGWNQGLRKAEGEYILILNNDVIVGPDWLENMVRLAESDPTFGLIGPRSNYIAGPQIVPNVPYKHEMDIQPFIQKWQSENDLSATEFGFIKGFCHLIPRAVFEKVGFYDERFGKGNFEDDDYCMRVHYHGYRAAMANDSFIHHFGSVSFKQESVDWQALMVENQKKYTEKWSKGPSAIHDTQVSETNSKILDLLEAGKQAYEQGDLALARNQFLEAQAQDPLNAEVYCNLGIILFHEKNFQEALTLFLKCIELDPKHQDAAGNALECLITSNGAISQVEAETLITRFPLNPVFNDYARNFPAPKGEKAPPKKSMPLPVWKIEVERFIETSNLSKAMDLLEVHLKSGSDLGDCYNYLGIIAHACQDKEMALQQFTQAAKHLPHEPDIIFNLADSYISLNRHKEAIAFLRKCALDISNTSLSITTQINPPAGMDVDYSASAEQIEQAIEAGNFNADQYYQNREVNQNGEALIRQGCIEDAEQIFDLHLQTSPEDFRALNNRGLIAWYQGQGELAFKYFQRCLNLRPAWLDAAINAFDVALSLNKINELLPYLDRSITAQSNPPPEIEAMRTHILTNGPAIYSAKNFDELQAGAEILKQAEKATQEAKLGDAILIYLEALKIRPQNPQALNGLGIIAFGEKRYDDAYGLFDSAATLNPLDQDILMNLWECAQALRREKDVLPILKSSLAQNPAFEDVKAVVREFA